MMSQSLSIRFQRPEHLTGPAKELFAQLRSPGEASLIVLREEVEPLALPPSREQEDLNLRALRHRLRKLEKERTLNTVEGTATWVLTPNMSVNPDLGERIDDRIVGAGLGTGHLVYGPPDLCLPSGSYVAILAVQVTHLLDGSRARMKAEVILNNQQYLSRQTKTMIKEGAHTFRLPFRVWEEDLLRQSTPLIQVRLDMRSVVGVAVTQVAIISMTSSVRNLAARARAHLASTSNAWFGWLGRRIASRRA